MLASIVHSQFVANGAFTTYLIRMLCWREAWFHAGLILVKRIAVMVAGR